MTTYMRSLTVGAVLGALCVASPDDAAAQTPFGWRVGIASWSFNPFTVFEAIDKTAALGMTCIEPFEGQRVMAESDLKFGPDLPDDVIAQLRAKLAQAKVELTSIYIHNIPGDEPACRHIFDFARKLGAKFIVSEPAPEALDMIEKCCNEYGISVAIHNHATGSSRYWNPEEVMRVCEGRGPRIGACGDTGHWIRSGIKPADAFRVLGKRLMAVHLKDLNAATPEAVDVPWGKGCGELEPALRTLRELRVTPALFAIEYESSWDNNLPQIDESGKWFAQVMNTFAAEANREDSLFAGWSSVDITPPRPIALVGQFNKRISTGTRDPLTLTALALETRGLNGEIEQAVLISCDLVSVQKPITDRLREAVKAQIPDLDPRKIVLSATHTHDGPGLLDSTYKGLYDVSNDPGVMTASEYGNFFVERATQAVVEAWQNRAPAGMSWALGTAAVGINRRAQYADGTAAMYGDTSRDDFIGFEGSADPGIQLLFFWHPDKTLTGVLVNIACSSQETESLMEISADFWHEVRQELRRRHGPDLFILPQCAAAGDNSPHRMFRKAAEEAMLARKGISRRQEIANRIANAVDEALPGAVDQAKFAIPLRHLLIDVDLPEMQPPVTPFYETDSVHPVQFHALRIGDVAMATNPFELFLDYGLRIQARTRAILTLPVQLSDAQSGYLPTAEAIKGGGYSADKFIVSPEGGQLLVNETVAALNSLWP